MLLNEAAEIIEIEAKIKKYNDYISDASVLSGKLSEGKEALEQAKRTFLNGGHIFYGKPLAGSEIDACISKLSSASSSIGETILYYQESIKKLQSQRYALMQELPNSTTKE